MALSEAAMFSIAAWPPRFICVVAQSRSRVPLPGASSRAAYPLVLVLVASTISMRSTS